VLLRLLAALSPDGVRRSLLDGLCVDPEALDDALDRCTTGSLLAWTESGDTVIMHRLLGRVLRERDQAGGQWADTVPRLQRCSDRGCSPRRRPGPSEQRVQSLPPRSRHCGRPYVGTGAAELSLAERLMMARNWAVLQLMGARDLSRAIEAGTRNLADRERLLGPDHPHTLSSRFHLALVYESARRLNEAISLYEQTLADRERVLGTDHPHTVTSRTNLASAHRSAGRLDEAIALYEQTLADRERVLGPNHPDTPTARNNLAADYYWAERLDEAIALHERTLADRERVLGPDHPQTLTSRKTLASLRTGRTAPGQLQLSWAATSRRQATAGVVGLALLMAQSVGPRFHRCLQSNSSAEPRQFSRISWLDSSLSGRMGSGARRPLKP
jgi:tetratricopeptide (TPR) repeat protein